MRTAEEKIGGQLGISPSTESRTVRHARDRSANRDRQSEERNTG